MERFRLVRFPAADYPVMYRAYHMPHMHEKYRLANITDLEDSTDALNALVGIYEKYYDLNLNLNTIYQVSYLYDKTPYDIVFVVSYLVNNVPKYIWEHFSIWVNIKNLNSQNKI